jgi:hypothetical protein
VIERYDVLFVHLRHGCREDVPSGMRSQTRDQLCVYSLIALCRLAVPCVQYMSEFVGTPEQGGAHRLPEVPFLWVWLFGFATLPFPSLWWLCPVSATLPHNSAHPSSVFANPPSRKIQPRTMTPSIFQMMAEREVTLAPRFHWESYLFLTEDLGVMRVS